MHLSSVVVLLFVLGIHQALGKCGSYTASDGSKYNLNDLTKTSDYTGTEEGQPSWSYSWNFCQVISVGTCFPAPMVAQISGTGTCISLGYGVPKIAQHPDGPKKGVMLTYTNTQDNQCGTTNRVSNVIVGCSQAETTLVKITEPGSCVYDFTMTSKYACPIGGSGPGGLSGGSIFLIIFFVSAVLYFAIGSIVMWKVKGASGIEILPNSAFWVGLPGLLKDGVLFLKGKVTGTGYTPV